MEMVHFIREGTVEPYCDETMEIMRKCKDDSCFFNSCIQYRQFREITGISDKMARNAALMSFYKEHDIHPGYDLTNPILIYRIKLWERYFGWKTSINCSENSDINTGCDDMPPGFEEEISNPSREAIHRLQKLSFGELDRFLCNCVKKEKYEKAALIKKEMDRRTRISGTDHGLNSLCNE